MFKKLNVPLRRNLPLIAIDYETFAFTFDIDDVPIDRVTRPRPVVLSVADVSDNFLVRHADRAKYNELAELVVRPGHLLAGHNIAFDLAVLTADRPDLITAVFDKYEAGEIYDTMIAEKFINLYDLGIIRDGFHRGDYRKFFYGLDVLLKKHCHIDVSHYKKDEDAWRTRYGELYDIPLESWPFEAKDYALGDTKNLLLLIEKQFKRASMVKARTGYHPFDLLPFICMSAFDLYLMGSLGIKTDPEAIEEMEKWVDEQLTEESLKPIFDAGIYTPPCPGRPYKNNPEKFTKPKKGSISKEPLKKHVCKLIREGLVEPHTIILTKKAKQEDDEFRALFRQAKEAENPSEAIADLFEFGGYKYVKDLKAGPKECTFEYWQYLSLDQEFQAENKEASEILKSYCHRQEFCKIKDTELPRMKLGPFLYPCYDELKETGRTSSYGSKLYPSGNIQQIYRKVRKCYTAREGHLMLSVDFGGMEMVTAAQTCLDRLGFSVLAEKLNAGFDMHSYTGSQFALKVDDEFSSILEDDPSLSDNPDEVYRLFKMMPDMAEDLQKLYKYYRKLAKPFNLGKWGGMGAAKMQETAKKPPHELDLEVDDVKRLIEILYEVLPEMKQYFDMVTTYLKDHHNSFEVIDKKTGKPKVWDKFHYQSPYGMYRPNCDYCVVMNGMALQTPGAEGARTALHYVVRECFDPSLKSILYGNFLPYGFIHDEILGDVVEDREIIPAVSERLDYLMTGAFALITPDVKIKTEPALMKFWSKMADPVYDNEDCLMYLANEDGLYKEVGR